MLYSMTAANALSTPTVGDARRVAGALPGSVLLFGSVARGTASPRSDIDLMVIVDRINRDDQLPLLKYLDHLEDVAAEVDHRARLVVIDWAEWESRRRVPPRVEHAADSYGIWLRKGKPGHSIAWGKVKGIREETTDTLCHHLSNVLAHLRYIDTGLAPSVSEHRLVNAQEDEDEYWSTVRGRLADINHNCHTALEESLLALCCLTGQPYGPDSQHKLTRIFERLPLELRDVMLGMTFPLDAEALIWIQKWRSVRSYEDALRMSTTPDTTGKLAWVASDVASFTSEMVEVAIGTTIYSAYTANIADLVIRFAYAESGNREASRIVGTPELARYLNSINAWIGPIRESLSGREWLYPNGVPPNGWTPPPANRPSNVYLPWGETWD